MTFPEPPVPTKTCRGGPLPVARLSVRRLSPMFVAPAAGCEAAARQPPGRCRPEAGLVAEAGTDGFRRCFQKGR